MGKKASTTYKPRQGGSHKNKMHFTDKQLQEIKEEYEEILHALGYVCDGRDPLTYNYINYEGKHSKNSEEKLNAFKYINAYSIKQRL